MNRAKKRAQRYAALTHAPEQGGTATDSREALRQAWNHLLSEIKQLEDWKPDHADVARWYFAHQVDNLAASVPVSRWR